MPLLKSPSADTTLPKSYRPVSLLPIMSKVMEKVLFSQLVTYLENNNLVHPNLHGSRQGHDTSTALLQLYDKWVEEVEQGKKVGILICDQSAAFDLCDHSILIQKLNLMGLDDSALRWTKSYLEDRTQSCFVDGEMSPSQKLLECGVPQGSVGGPLLWLVYTCDQPDVIHDHVIDTMDPDRGCQRDGQKDCGELVGYVDDGAYSFGHQNPHVLSSVLSEKYTCLENWMNSNRLVINPDKTHLMILGSKKSVISQGFNITAGGFTVRPTETEKLLGGQIHQSLKWACHIVDGKLSLVKQLTSRNNALKMVCKHAEFKTRLMLANGVFHSKLVYLINVWGNAEKYLIKALQTQQLIAARTVCGRLSAWWSRLKILKTVRWLSVNQLVEYHLILQAYKTLNSGKPKSLHSNLTTAYPYDIRNASIGNIRLRGYVSVNTFKYRAMIAYNRVPAQLKVGSLVTVKRKLKQWVWTNIPFELVISRQTRERRKEIYTPPAIYLSLLLLMN